VIVATLAIVVAVTIGRLPPSISFDDFGDMQLASMTLGIMHPPGYSGYVSLGYLLTRIPGVDPAYIVSVACLASGIVALLLGILIQVRLGVSVWIACAWSLILLSHPQVWSNLVAPEVYMPTLMFLAAAAYVLVKYAHLGRRRDLLLSAVLFGVALADRPPVLFTLPFFLVAWWFAQKRWEASRRRSAASLSLAAACAALPVLYLLGFLWLQDRPDATYNYIEQYNAQWEILPSSDHGWQAKAERIRWHVSGMQFKKSMGNTWRGVRQKLRWLRHEVFSYSFEELLRPLVLVVALGLAISFRRRKITAWILIGLALVSVTVAAIYHNSTHFGQCDDTIAAVAGNACSTNADCGSGTCVFFMECSATADNPGDSCTQDSECPTGTCELKDKCDAASEELAGTACSVDKDCRGICIVTGWLVDFLAAAIIVSLQGGTMLIVAVGLVFAYRRCRVTAWLLLGMAIAAIVFVSAYRVYGQSADILPLLFSGAVLGGVAVSPLVARQSNKTRWVVQVGVLFVVIAVTVVDAPKRRHTGERADATSYLAELDMGTLPANSVICTGWHRWPPLRYAQIWLTPRPDIHIINADPRNWLQMIAGFRNRPVFFTQVYQEVQHLSFTKYRNLWRVEGLGRRNPPSIDPGDQQLDVGG